MEERFKALEIELAYLRKTVEELKQLIEKTPLEVHFHYYKVQLGDKYLKDNFSK